METSPGHRSRGKISDYFSQRGTHAGMAPDVFFLRSTFLTSSTSRLPIGVSVVLKRAFESRENNPHAFRKLADKFLRPAVHILDEIYPYRMIFALAALGWLEHRDFEHVRMDSAYPNSFPYKGRTRVNDLAKSNVLWRFLLRFRWLLRRCAAERNQNSGHQRGKFHQPRAPGWIGNS